MREDGRGQGEGLLCSLLLQEGLLRRDSLPSPWTHLFMCGWGPSAWLFPSALQGREDTVWSAGKKGLDAEIRTRGEEGQCFVGPAVAPQFPCAINIPSVFCKTLGALQPVYRSRAPVAQRYCISLTLDWSPAGPPLSPKPLSEWSHSRKQGSLWGNLIFP